MFKWLFKKQKHILSIYLDVEKCKKDKSKNNCNIYLAKSIADDKLKQKINELVDYIRENHNLEEV